MADKIVVVTQQCSKPIKLVKWKVSEGNSISIGCVLFIYKIDGDKTTETFKSKATKAGTVHRILQQEGDVVKSGQNLIELMPCIHPTVMKDMCAECGADLRKQDSEITASVPMIHSVPELKVSLEQAQKLGKADNDRLLKDRKLVLLVDLDQTLIHTTNDNIPPNIKDVYHFQLYGPNSPWYHTRLRPGTHRFLSNMSSLYELHICTFGARNYAHMIAMFLDHEGKLFSHRILSRDECFNSNSKTANLKALFPCGDNMVCIIDDREDVWCYASNLIHVKPYHFFQHTGDINAPPGLDKHEDDDKEGVDLSKIKTNAEQKVNGTNEEKEKVMDEKEFWEEENNQNGSIANTEKLPKDPNITSKDEDPNLNSENEVRKSPESDKLSSKTAETQNDVLAPGSDEVQHVLKENLDPKSESFSSKNGSDSPKSETNPSVDKTIPKSDEKDQKTSDKSSDNQINEKCSENDDKKSDLSSKMVDCEKKMEVDPENKVAVHQDKMEVLKIVDEHETKMDVTENVDGQVVKEVSKMVDGQSKMADCQNDEMELSEKEEVQNKMVDTKDDKDVNKTTDDDKKKMDEQECKVADVLESKMEVSEKEDEHHKMVDAPDENEVNKTTDETDAEENNMLDKPDYKMADKEKVKKNENDLIEIEDPDDYLLYLEEILTLIHRAFYEKFDLMKSGDIPDLKKIIPEVRSNVLNGLKLVFSGLVPTYEKLEQSKAYQVAKSLGAKVTQDLESDSTHLVAVRPGTAKVNLGRRKKTLKIVTSDWLWACAERWEHVDERLYPLNSKGSKNRHPPPHCSSPQHAPNFETGETRRRTASGRFMDTINPLMSFSSADIADMDREVEDIFNESESESENKKLQDAETEVPRFKPKDTDSESSSSDESLNNDHPHGWKPEELQSRKRSREEDLDRDETNDDSTADEFPSTKFRRGEAIPSDLEFGQESNSEGSVDAPDEIDDGEWNMMGAALEREFLSNN